MTKQNENETEEAAEHRVALHALHNAAHYIDEAHRQGIDLSALLPLILSNLKIPPINIRIGDQTINIAPILQQFLPVILGALLNKGGALPVVPGGPSTPPTTPGTPTTPKPPIPIPPEPDKADLVEIRLTKRFMEGDRNAADAPDPGRGGKQRGFDDSPQMIDERGHFDISPFDAQGEEITTGDERLPPPRDNSERSPLRYRWWLNGQQQNDTGRDKFRLESYARNADDAYSPVLCLVEQGGPGGQNKAEMEAYYPVGTLINGRKITRELVSNRVSWFTD